MHAFLIRKMLQISAKEAFEVEIFYPPFCSTFCSTGTGNILPFFAFRGKRKTPDFVWKSGVCSDLLFLKVVPPGIEPFASVYSNSLSDCTLITLSFMKAIELASH
ncbi:hypothetical protein [Bacteroides rodentium]